MKKRAFLIITVGFICLAFMLTACRGAGGSYVLNISGAEINEEVYTYYLDLVMRSPKKYFLEQAPSEKAARRVAIGLCKQYVAANSLLAEKGFSPGYDEKLKASDKVNGLWSYLGDHYEKIGVSKQTLTKIERAALAKETLILRLYDPESDPEIHKELLEYYKNNFVSFISINSDFTNVDENGKSFVMVEEEKQALRSKFEAMKLKITDGDDLGKVGELFYSEMGSPGSLPEPSLISKGSSLYPRGFFEKISKLKYNEPDIIELDSYIFLVVRNELTDGDENFYDNRSQMLTSLKGDLIDEMLADRVALYEAEVDEKSLVKIYESLDGVLQFSSPTSGG
ncbi:MAG: hypothetical protein GX345_05790 [Clostridiales bacterium]|nr:hypothetical protein [Clostridiales bacterium]